MRSSSLAAALLASASVCTLGCTDYAGMARARAASDLRCPEPEITVVQHGSKLFRTSGCGQTASYACFTEGSSNPFMASQSPMMAMMTSDEICVREGGGAPPVMACPPGTGMTDRGCVPVVSTECPAGMHFVAGRGCVANVSPEPAQP